MGFAPFFILMIGAVVVTLMLFREEWRTTRRKIVFVIGTATITLVVIVMGFYFGLYLGLWWHWR